MYLHSNVVFRTRKLLRLWNGKSHEKDDLPKVHDCYDDIDWFDYM